MDEAPLTGKFAKAEDAKTFLLAGNATVTLRSLASGTRYTFRVRQIKTNGDKSPHFVQVMYGSDNEESFAFLGTLFDQSEYRHGRKSNFPVDDVREKAFTYFWKHVQAGQLPKQLEVWHEGRCGRCGRKLTVPESIERGFGPECSGKV